MFAYLHHLYMDFAQPQWLQVAGQLASYLISVPAAVVTIFSTLALVAGSKMRWQLPSVLLYLGVMGWAIGGVAAVIDSTVMVNSRFHNTLWVPAHFHTYYVMGVVLMILGTVFHVAADLSKVPESRRYWRIVKTVGVGGYGFLLMFYVAGVAGIPRRYAVYPEEVARGIQYGTCRCCSLPSCCWAIAVRVGSGPSMRARLFVLPSLFVMLAGSAGAQPDPVRNRPTKRGCATARSPTSS